MFNSLRIKEIPFSYDVFDPLDFSTLSISTLFDLFDPFDFLTFWTVPSFDPLDSLTFSTLSTLYWDRLASFVKLGMIGNRYEMTEGKCLMKRNP